MTTRGLGHIPDEEKDVLDDLAHRHVGTLLGPPSSAPASLDYSALLDAVQNQGPTNSCVGQAFATSLYIRSKIAGAPIARPSAKAIYDVARLLDGPRRSIVDIGSRPRLAIEGMQDYGLVADERWPLTASNVNVPPPLDVFRAGLDAMLSGHYRIGAGIGASSLARSALARGFVPFFAMPVDASFYDHDGSAVVANIASGVIGNHAMAIVGYDESSLLVVNSWGAEWGRSGFCRLAFSLFDATAFDVIVPTIIPSHVR
jgi:hypothetical protein